MSSYAALISPVTISGSRKSDGTANASGLLWAFVAGTNTQTAIYADAAGGTVVSQPVTLDEGGRVNVSDYPNGLYATGVVRIVIQDSTGTLTVSDCTFVPASAGNTGVSNLGWSGSTVDATLTALYESAGGVDGTYREHGGATDRPIQDKFREAGISVKDYGALGDGAAIDTSAIQTAVNRAVALGGAIVNIPPGIYRTDQAITITSGTGVRIRGAGAGATSIYCTNAVSDAFTFSTPIDCEISDLTINQASSTSGVAVDISASTRFRMSGVLMGSGFAYGLNTTGSSSNLSIDGCYLFATTRAVLLSDVSGFRISNSILRNDSAAMVEFMGATSSGLVENCSFPSTTTGILFNASLTGRSFAVIGCPGLGSLGTPFDLSGLSTDPRLRQWANGVDGYASTITTGGTFTPTRSKGPHMRVRATTTGLAYTIAAPVPAPSSTQRDVTLRLVLYNNAGGAVTGWTFNAAFKVSAAASTVDGDVTSYTFLWDPDASVWRDVGRTVTT